jgi:hypothetical protein
MTESWPVPRDAFIVDIMIPQANIFVAFGKILSLSRKVTC